MAQGCRRVLAHELRHGAREERGTGIPCRTPSATAATV